MNKKKIIIIASSVFTLGILGTTALTLSMMNGQDGKPPGQSSENPITWEKDPVYEGEMPLEQIESMIGNNEGEVLQRGQAEAIAAEMRRLISEFKFVEAEVYMLTAIKDYNVGESDSFKSVLEPLRMDIPVLSQLEFLRSYEERDTILDSINGLKDPTSMLVSTLWLDTKDREAVIVSENSLNPVFTAISDISSPTRIKNEIPDYPEAEDAYEIEFKADGVKLKATMVDVYGWLYFYSITAEDGNHSFITIKEWRAIRDEVFGNPDDLEEPVGEPLEETENITEEELNGENSAEGEN